MFRGAEELYVLILTECSKKFILLTIYFGKFIQDFVKRAFLIFLDFFFGFASTVGSVGSSNCSSTICRMNILKRLDWV